MEKLKLPKLKSVSSDKKFDTNEEWVDSISSQNMPLYSWQSVNEMYS